LPEALDRIEREVVACRRCPELRAYTAEVAREKRRAYRDWDYWGKPVPGFGDPRARVLLVGLAPGAHGSNRTGRMFTGDASGEWLYRALYRAGFASQPDSHARGDGLELRDAFISAAIRCAPPQNKPTPRQRANCFPFLEREFAALEQVRVVVALGKLADDTVYALLRGRFTPVPARAAFAHGARTRMVAPGGRALDVVASYHPSRQNTNTGKLTEPMLDAIFATARTLLGD
jgi:uracil-DNA glycosylase family 4